MEKSAVLKTLDSIVEDLESKKNQIIRIRQCIDTGEIVDKDDPRLKSFSVRECGVHADWMFSSWYSTCYFSGKTLCAVHVADGVHLHPEFCNKD